MTAPEMIAALQPLRDALLWRAAADAERTLAQARLDAAEVVGVAEREAAELTEQARARGEAEAEEVLAIERARARRAVRHTDLAARTTAYERLRAEVVATLRRLRDEPGLRERLAAEARRLLGPDAEIADAPGGGVYGRITGARVDCSLDAFAERAVVALGPELDGLWES